VIRVATLNLLKEPKLLKERLDLLVDTLKFEDLDFLCLQEVPGPEAAGFYVGDVLSFKLGMDYKVIGETKKGEYGNITLSRHPIAVHELNVKMQTPDVNVPVLVSKSEVDGRAVYIFNAHFKWGAGFEKSRMKEARHVSVNAHDIFTRQPGGHHRQHRPIILLAGDLNAVPESRTVRYLRGLDLGVEDDSTLWLDAWNECGDPEQSGHTSGDVNHWSKRTFESVGSIYRPEQTPKRRIDYIMAYEWAWGSAGQPAAARTFGSETFYDPELGDLPVSDHKGLIADFWTPEPGEA
jgi:endonuclease/exonuclease/phosphatase family metal-dependent hydrolase